jgi:hypothetical protein
MAANTDSAPVKKIQLEGKIIAITGANRGMYTSTQGIAQHTKMIAPTE